MLLSKLFIAAAAALYAVFILSTILRKYIIYKERFPGDICTIYYLLLLLASCPDINEEDYFFALVHIIV